MKKAIVLFSGGLDSTTCLAIARAQGFSPWCLTIDYGQRHAVELKAAERIAAFWGVPLRILHCSLREMGGSALTSELPVPMEEPSQGERIPLTYVPARNTIFLALALGFAEVEGAQDIFLGINAVDYSGYPDCRPEFVSAFEVLAQLATKAGVEGTRFHIHTPLAGLSKAQIIQRGVELGVDHSMTHSCYAPSIRGLACGQCESCRLRRRGFLQAGVVDSTRYEG
ncbi:MAG: 7-cyano-7-deazaguanine synthase QueC [Proteobacteria bacterium]|nr:7-cyano-7-deazaguanine synthase QueC [Cystobacterineae bacterium]MCL2258326.1 7-cyano-7-deazaguanine synthase QueC [Cystobacterineae bacterium]MCL2315351.1 7-cyano-7-deazaguanine synthase QueC [Pseudomonadota bacterium]